MWFDIIPIVNGPANMIFRMKRVLISLEVSQRQQILIIERNNKWIPDPFYNNII